MFNVAIEQGPHEAQGFPKLVTFFCADVRLRNALASQVAPESIVVQGIETADAFLDLCQDHPADAIVLDLASLPEGEGPASFLSALALATGVPPVLTCIGSGDGIEWRLEAMRCGARACFSQPVAADELARHLVDLLALNPRERRILIVGDDTHQSRLYTKILSDAGMSVQVESDPSGVIESLRTARPDLILMDLYLPVASAAKLTGMVRHHGVYFDIPIVFLCADDDQQRQTEALRMRAESFVVKPARRAALVAAVEHQIGMHRWLKQRWLADQRRKEEWGLIRKREFLVYLDGLMRAPGAGGDWGLMVIDLDDPQRLLQRLGVCGTERLVQGVGPLIARHLEGTESTTRVGDFRYALVARRPDTDTLGRLGEQIAQSIRDFAVDTDEGQLRSTVSIGIVPCSPPASDAITLITDGCKAAMLANRSGGNRIAFWRIETASGDDQADRLILPLLDGALAGGRGGFELNFQPILSPHHTGGELYEALLRLHAPERELIPPVDFLRVADRHGKGASVDRWVLSHALDVLMSHRKQRHPLRLLVHQRLRTVAAPDWLLWLRGQIVERDLIKHRPLLVFQAHEMVTQLELARSLMPELRRLGVEVCATNVTGDPDQLAMLDALAIRMAKVAINRLEQSGLAEAGRLISNLRERGVIVVAAGVEDADTLAAVWGLRPDYVQGNFLQMPSGELGLEMEMEMA